MSDKESIRALRALAYAWRGDWSDFDGRTLRDQIDSWIALHEDEPDNAAAAEEWADRWVLCIEHMSWLEWCRTEHAA